MLATTVAAGLLSLVACAVPLGPSYTVEQQQLEVRYFAASQPHLGVRASYRLMNTGNQALSSLEVTLPAEKAYGRQNLRVLLDNHGLAPQVVSEPRRDTFRISFDAVWPRRARHTVEIAYDLTASVESSPRMVIGRDAFLLCSGSWYPLLLPQRGIFAKGGERPDPTQISIWVPQDFVALSSGRATGTHRRNGEFEHRFRLSKQDFDPFVVAGRYHEQNVHTPNGTVIFWTFQPAPAEQVQRAGARIAATVRTYERTFGAIGKGRPTVWVAEVSQRGEKVSREIGQPAAFSLPNVVLLNSVDFTPAGLSEGTITFVELELAATWFGNTLRGQPQSPLPLMASLVKYAARVAGEARGELVEPRERAVSLLRRFEDARKRVEEKPTTVDVESWREQMNLAKAELFLLALEAQCGKEKLRRALAWMVRSLRGKSVGYEDLRSALEAETRQNLAEFFRVWLNHPGIPGDFRARYEEKNEPTK